MLLPGDCDGPSVTVTAPEGVVISDGTISGNYDTETSFPLTLQAIGGGEITGVTIDDVAATITESVVAVPYTAQKVVVSGTAVTVHGTETIEDEYTVDVDYEALRIKVGNAGVVVDQNAHTVTGTTISPYVQCNIYKNGERVSWAQHSRYSYAIKIGDNWSDYYDISYNNGGASFAVLAGSSSQVKIKYEYGGTTIESETIDIDVSTDYEADENITITTETEGITIDNENRTITGTVAAEAEVAFRASYPDTEISAGNVYLFYSDRWLFTLTSATHTGAEVATVSSCVPAVALTASVPFTFGETYTVNITTS